MSEITKKLDNHELYLILAEEAAELAQAAAKMSRKLSGKNPTPKSVSECQDDVIEELSDVQNICDELDIHPNPDIIRMKHNRWIRRLGLNDYTVNITVDKETCPELYHLLRYETHFPNGSQNNHSS